MEISDDEARELLKGHRRTIDNLDAALVHILAERFRCTQQVGRLKAMRIPSVRSSRSAA